MKPYKFILKSFRLLSEHQPGKLTIIFLLTLIMGVNSGFSIMLLVPLLQLLNVGLGEQPEGIASFFQKLFENTGITPGIEAVLLIFVVMLTLNALLQYWKSILDTSYQQSFIYQLRRRLFRKIIMADWPLLNSKSKTNHLQILTREVPNLASYYYFYLRLLTTLVLTTCYVVYALSVSAGFTLVIIAIGVVLFVVLRKFLLRAFQLGEDFVSSYSRLLKYIDDFWQTVKIAKVHNSEDFYNSRFDEANTTLLGLELRMQKNWSMPRLIYSITGIIVLVVVVYLGYHSGRVPLASFFILILLYSRIFPQFVGINSDLNMIISNAASVKMVMKLDEELPRPVADQKHFRNRVEPLKEISLENLYFSYSDGIELFNDFSETIPANSVTGILGESGIGKTTLIDIIAGLQKPDKGRLLVDGRVLDGDLLASWKSGIGYLPQDPFFVDGTLRENLIWDSDSEVSDEEILSVLSRVNATHLVNRYEAGLDTYVANYPFSFSGGECQRLALARVLLRKPRLLLLDEATSSLDSDNETIIMEVISRLKEQVTVVFVTHRVSLRPYFDKVIKLR